MEQSNHETPECTTHKTPLQEILSTEEFSKEFPHLLPNPIERSIPRCKACDWEKFEEWRAKSTVGQGRDELKKGRDMKWFGRDALPSMAFELRRMCSSVRKRDLELWIARSKDDIGKLEAAEPVDTDDLRETREEKEKYERELPKAVEDYERTGRWLDMFGTYVKEAMEYFESPEEEDATYDRLMMVQFLGIWGDKE